MAEQRARHAFGSSDRVAESIANGVIDSYDILFLDGDTDSPKIGWVDKNGNPVILKDEKADLTELETEVAELETQIATKVSADEVDTKIATALDNFEVDVDVEVEYEISHKPSGTLVDYRDKEIRVMIPADTQFELQNSGEGSDANTYYIGFKAYAPDDAVSFKEAIGSKTVEDTMFYFENNEFAGVDENGRKYSIVWLSVAVHTDGVWTYHGAKSTSEHYVGWYYPVEWYNANGVMIASDCIRINLSNEECHSAIEPYYVGDMMKEIDTKIEEKMAEMESAIEIVEF